MIKVAFDTSPLGTGHSSRGIGAYTRSLLEALRKEREVEIVGIQNADLIHYPFFDLFQHTLAFKKKIPTVVTIHDVIPLVFPDHYPAGIKGGFATRLQKLALKNVSAVITDSDASKKEIMKYLGVPAGKIYPVPLAPATHFKKISDRQKLEAVRKKYNLPEEFALYMGNVNWNKNLLNLTEAAIGAGIDLVLAGKSFEERDSLNHPEQRSFKNFLDRYLDNPKVHILGFVEAEELVAITNLARVVLLPSFAEGFGLPILEAQICGTPVVTSNTSSMPEAAGNGALLVDPHSVESISQAIVKIEEDKNLRENLIKEGLENVKRFSWDKCAKETVSVYSQVLERP